MATNTLRADRARAAGARTAWSTLALLLLLNVMNVVDRNLPFVLIESIRRDIPLSDTQIGLLGGVVFTLIYALVSLPAARLADRANRTRLISAAAVLWTAMTGAAGLANSFLQLAVSRVGLAVGESAIQPAATSLIADLFDRGRRTALSIYFVGTSLGIMVGLGLGGWVSDRYDWRTTFFIFGAGGLLVALLFAAVVREPARVSEVAAVRSPGSWRALFRDPVFRHLAVASAIFMFTTMSNAHFAPAFMIRRFGMSAGEAGLSFGVLMGLCGVLGTLAGGIVTDRLALRDPRLTLWAPAAAIGLAGPLFLAAWLAPRADMLLLLLVAPSFLAQMGTGPIVAAVQSAAGPQQRATAVALLSFGMYAIGGALGPVVTGMISDALRPQYGADSLRFGLSLAAALLLWCAAHLVAAARAQGRQG